MQTLHPRTPAVATRRQQLLTQLASAQQPLLPAAPPRPLVAVPLISACPSAHELDELVAGRLRGALLTAVAHHVAECPCCAAQAEEAQRAQARRAREAESGPRRHGLQVGHVAGLAICGMLALLANTGVIDVVNITTSAPAPTPAAATPLPELPATAAPSGEASVLIPPATFGAPAAATAPAGQPAPTAAVPVTAEPAPAAASAPAAGSIPAVTASKSADTASAETGKIVSKQADVSAAPKEGVSTRQAKPVAPTEAAPPKAESSVTPEPRRVEAGDHVPARLQPTRL